jgi:vesicular inhibitory amino acid transporter
MEAFDIDYNVNKYLDEISNSQFNEINDDTYVLHDANMNPQSTVSSISKVTIVLLLLNTMLGSGILNQPYVISQSGIVGSAVLFIFSGFFTWIGMQTLIICGSSHGKLDYADIAEYAFGPYGKQAVNFSVVLNTFGGLMSYITIMGGTLSELFQSWGCGSEKVICDVYSVTIIVTIFLIFPLCLLRYFGEIVQKLSLISILGLFGVVALVLIASPIEATDNRNKVLAFNAVGKVSFIY